MLLSRWEHLATSIIGLFTIIGMITTAFMFWSKFLSQYFKAKAKDAEIAVLRRENDSYKNMINAITDYIAKTEK